MKEKRGKEKERKQARTKENVISKIRNIRKDGQPLGKKKVRRKNNGSAKANKWGWNEMEGKKCVKVRKRKVRNSIATANIKENVVLSHIQGYCCSKK